VLDLVGGDGGAETWIAWAKNKAEEAAAMSADMGGRPAMLPERPAPWFSRPPQQAPEPLLVPADL
jgi:hypothetical protein